MTDPMTGYEQAESEAVDRQDEARREQHYAEAVQAARYVLRAWGENVGWLVQNVGHGDWPATSKYACFRVLDTFKADYGTPALLRVIATALEAK